MTLPQRAVGNLRAVASILAPPTPTSSRPKHSATFSLVEVSRPTCDSDEIPFMNEKSSSVTKVRPFSPYNIIRRNSLIYIAFFHIVLLLIIINIVLRRARSQKQDYRPQAFCAECPLVRGARPQQQQDFQC